MSNNLPNKKPEKISRIVENFCELHKGTSEIDSRYLLDAARVFSKLPVIKYRNGKVKKLIGNCIGWEEVHHSWHDWLRYLEERSPFAFCWALEMLVKLEVKNPENQGSYGPSLFSTKVKENFTTKIPHHFWLFKVPDGFTLNGRPQKKSLKAGDEGIVRLQRCHLSDSPWGHRLSFFFSDLNNESNHPRRDDYGICPDTAYFPAMHWKDGAIVMDEGNIDGGKEYNCSIPLSWIIGEIIPESYFPPYTKLKYLDLKNSNEDLFKLTDDQNLLNY